MVLERSVSAVLDKELEAFLMSIGEYDRITSGEAKCSICGVTITPDNLSLVIPAGNRVAYVCQRQMCMVKFTLGDSLDD